MTLIRDPADWVKASASGPDNACVEMRRQGAAVEIRDTKSHGVGPVLRSRPAAFEAWLAGAKLGELDCLI
ncbi:DUF397 domain-containing protein [Kineosporia sp. J2-2]|uniref:DUF397 domain-containing protein n=1 Tax=Kineosporia corallincola TaxID=2835133 RepID=A0ABS5TP38_9ACTN|nr:DUF397 domain-containing protein [Kineosporia corallincola]MBT0772861.1 DUF397 domain-containing protein [Kineosporia corallincola]